MRQPQLFETEDQYGNDIIQDPKLPHVDMSIKERLIDPEFYPPSAGTPAAKIISLMMMDN